MIDQMTKKLSRFLPLTFRHVPASAEVDISHYVTFPPGFHGTNPAIVSCGEEYLVCLRGVNYELLGRRLTQTRFNVSNDYLTVNRFFLVDAAFRFRRELPGLDAAFGDIEDVKLFCFDGRIMGVGSSPNPAAAPGTRRMTLLLPDQTLDGGSRRHIASPFGFKVEKNWAPFTHEGALHFIYSFEPLMILRYDFGSGQTVFRDPRAATARHDMKFLIGGSAAGVAVADGFLFVAHRRRLTFPRLRRMYLSRFYLLDGACETLWAGPYFSIGATAIQIVNGFVLCGVNVIMSYGRDDRSGYLCRLQQRHVVPRPAAPVKARR